MTPEGFSRFPAGRAWVWLRDDLAASLRAAGLADPAVWDERLRAARPGARGRGAIARVALRAGGPRIVLKRLERGGLLAAVWRGRFPGLERIVANLTLPDRAVQRGIATPRAVALVAIPGPPGCWRGRLATEEIAGAEDLATRLLRGPLTPREATAVARLLKVMHGVGLEHRDLNLGNLILRAAADGPEAFVVDLDGSWLRERPLSFGVRQAALRRIERSCRRVLGAAAGATAADAIYAAYAEGDAGLAQRLAAGRGRGRTLLALRSVGRSVEGGNGR